jgi:hypothetical protein
MRLEENHDDEGQRASGATVRCGGGVVRLDKALKEEL